VSLAAVAAVARVNGRKRSIFAVCVLSGGFDNDRSIDTVISSDGAVVATGVAARI
jgi:hypothetical protein